MAITLKVNAQVMEPGASVQLGSLLDIEPGDLPEYVTLAILDLDRYPASSNGHRGSFTGSGNTFDFGHRDEHALLFTYTPQGYYNTTYGYLQDMLYHASDDVYRSEFLTLHGFGTAGSPDASLEARLTRAVEGGELTGYAPWLLWNSDRTQATLGERPLGLALEDSHHIATLDFVSRPGYVDATPGQATPGEIATVAQSFVGVEWNNTGCWVLACNISAAAGASLPLKSEWPEPDRLDAAGNGQWFVAYDGSKDPSADLRGDWVSHLRTGDIVTLSYFYAPFGGDGHVFTVASGSGYDAQLIDNTGAAAGASDVLVQPAHSVLSFRGLENPMQVVIYRVDTPVITPAKPLYLEAGAAAAVAPAFSATDAKPGGTITKYEFFDTGSGTFSTGGSAISAHSAATAFGVNADSLAQLQFTAGSGSATDAIMVRAFNGHYWGDWQSLDVHVGQTLNAPALVANQATFLVDTRETAIASLFTVADGTAAYYDITYVTDPQFPRTMGVAIWLNGATTIASGTSGNTYRVAATDFHKLTYFSLQPGTSDHLIVTAYDASGAASAATTVGMHLDPVPQQTLSHSWLAGSEVPLSEIWKLDGHSERVDYVHISVFGDFDNDVFHGVSGGTLNLNGAQLLPGGGWIVTMDDFSKLTYTFPSTPGTQVLTVGADWNTSGYQVLTTLAPTVHATGSTVSAGSATALSTLIATDSGATAPTFYRITDPAGAGHIELGDGVINLIYPDKYEPGVYIIQASDLAKVSYVAGIEGSSEHLYVSTLTGSFIDPATPTVYDERIINDFARPFSAEVIVPLTAVHPNHAPTGTVSVTGIAKYGQLLTAVNALADVDGMGALSYQWLRDGQSIAGANSARYGLGADDVGATISVSVSYVDGGGTTEHVISAATAPVAGLPEPDPVPFWPDSEGFAPVPAMPIPGAAPDGFHLDDASGLATQQHVREMASLDWQWQRGGASEARIAPFVPPQHDDLAPGQALVIGVQPHTVNHAVWF